MTQAAMLSKAELKEFDSHAGQVTTLPVGHDAWVVGNEPVVLIDWFGATQYAHQK